METLYRKVSLSIRPPIEDGYYHVFTENGLKRTAWFNSKGRFSPNSVYYWLEEITEQQIQSDKEEMVKVLEKVKKWGAEFGLSYDLYDEISLLIKKYKNDTGGEL